MRGHSAVSLGCFYLLFASALAVHADKVRRIPQLPPELERLILPDDIAEPVIVEPPHFPEQARDSVGETTVWVKLLVGRDGIVHKVEIAYCDRTGLGFEEEALRVILNGEFKPAMRRGKPIRKWMFYPVEFRRLHKVLSPVSKETDDGKPEPDSIWVEVLPEMIHEVPPEYPQSAKQAGWTGRVWIRALVDIDGSVAKALIARGSGHEVLDDACLKVATKNRFRPAISDGRPVAVWVTYKVEFSLSE